MRLDLSLERVEKLFPAFILIGDDYRLRAFGRSLGRQVPAMQPGMLMSDFFRGVRQMSGLTLADMAESGDMLQVMSLDGRVRLSGSVLRADQDWLLALRNVPSDFTLDSHDLEIDDFGHDDPVVAGLMLFALQKAMLADSQEIAVNLARERQRSLDLLERVTRISGFMAHDFNNFLSIIRLNADRIVAAAGKDPRIERLAQIIREMTDRGSDITRSLMTLSRQRHDSRLPLKVDELIADSVAFFQTLVGGGIVLEYELAAGERIVEVSRVGLLNCVINLLLNARDAMPEGGAVQISTGIRSAPLPGTPDGVLTECLAIRVTDTGHGMEPEVLARAFEPLFSTKPQGNGLGLASVIEFAREMGGDACIDSVPGDGTSVFLYIPLADAASTVHAAGADLRDPSLAGSGQPIAIVVEDEPYALEALTELLEFQDLKVIPCLSVEEARAALAATHDPRLLLSDILLGADSGIDLASQACEAVPGLSVILMSGYVPDSDKIRQDWQFVRKPLDTGLLTDMISRALATRDEGRAGAGAGVIS